LAHIQAPSPTSIPAFQSFRFEVNSIVDAMNEVIV
jgi:hypothetical protein